MTPQETITSATALITVVLVILIFTLPRRYLLVPFVLTACFVPADQHASLFSLHFYVNRILVFSGILRILIREEARVIRWTRLDKLVLAWALVGSSLYIMRTLELQSVIYKSGVLVDILGMYWITRQTILSWDDVKQVATAFAPCVILLVPFVAFEWSTGRNPFIFMGAVGTMWREGDFRCMASFRHPIVAGSFMACLVPLFISMAVTAQRKTLYWAAVAGAVFVALASNSSTPIGGLVAVGLLVAAFRYRHYGRYVAMGFFGSLAALHIVMKAPVWSLLFRIQILPGSTGYHRYLLIDAAIRHLSEWAFWGVESTEHWGWGLFDVTNHYILEGIRGGLLSLGLFTAVLVVAIHATGGYSARRVPRDQQWLCWALCASLVGHCIMFIGLGYFGQIEILLYLTFALAGFVYEQNILLEAAERVPRAGTASYALSVGSRYAGAALR